MSATLSVGDKIQGDYGAEGQIKRISADGLSATIQLVSASSWPVLMLVPVSHLKRIESYSKN